MITVLDITSNERALEGFLSLPSEVFHGDPDYSAPFRDAVVKSLRRETFAGAQRVLFATEDGRPVARVVARRSPALRDDAERPYGMLGFFAALDRPFAVQALLTAGVAWLRDEGAGHVIGPIDGDTWHSYRLSIGPFDHPPFLMEPYNPPYYAGLWESAGFEPLETYYSQRVEDVHALMTSQQERHDRALANGYTIRSLDRRRFTQELEAIYELSRRGFAGNFLYSEITLPEFLVLYGGARALIDPDLVLFARAPDGSDAAFLFALPDRQRAVAAMRGRRNAAALLRFQLNKGRADAVNIKSAAVDPAHRRQGLFAALTYRACRETIAKGYRVVNLCLIKEGNPSGVLAESLAIVLRRYVLCQNAG